jgi:putative ABC transport system permease protein
MKLIRFYKRARFFLLINITGLAIGFAVSIMLLLFVVNELSYDKHFADADRILRLNSVLGNYNVSINLRTAYTELPPKVPGIDYAAQILNAGAIDAVVEQNTFRGLKLLCVDPEFFKVFRMQFIAGTSENAVKEPNSVVITNRYADIMFGGAENAIGNQLSMYGRPLTVSGIVEELPANTHFTFDMLTNMPEYVFQGCEYQTYYLATKEASLDVVRKTIETEYAALMKNRFTDSKYYGYTEKLTDVYLYSKAGSGGFAKTSSIDKIRILAIIAAVILLLAITNFINLFITHGEARMKEIGVRKANGAGRWDIIRQFFTEVSIIVFIAFVLGFVLSIYITPYFSQLIKAGVSLKQVISPDFVVCTALLFILTVALSAGYPAFYLSRFSPLDILFKRVKFSKRRLTAGVVIFQSIMTLVLMAYIFTVNKQTKYLENCDKGYNPANVVSIMLGGSLYEHYGALKQEVMQLPDIHKISGSDHLIGGGCSGQNIASLEENAERLAINEYRIMPELCELMGFRLVEGNFLREEDRRDTVRSILLNEAAVRLLGLEQPVAGKYVNYKGNRNTKVLGVVKDFYYNSPGSEIEPLTISFCFEDIGRFMYFKFDENTSRTKIRESLNSVFNKFDPNFFVELVWDEDIYAQKFESIKTQSKIILLSTLLSLLIVILGLSAIHLYTTIRRTKEIGVRRIYGADYRSIFILLSSDTLKWIGIAALIAIPVEYYIVSYWLDGYANRMSLDIGIFLFPVLIQCTIALVISFGLTVKTLSQNPVTSLRAE